MRQRLTARGDAGITMIELIVVMLIMGAVSALVVSSVTWATRTTTSQSRNSNLWSHMQDATTQLVRDVNDASAITVASPNAMTALVVRDDKCQQRAWVADPATMRLSVTTTFFEQAECTGPSSDSTTRFIGNNAVGTNDVGTNPTRLLANPDGKTFRFFAQGTNTELAGSVDPDRVRRVEWTLLAEADEGYRDQTLTSGAAFIGHGSVASGNGQIAVSVAPTLCLSLRTGTGKCAPVVAPNVGPPDPVLKATMVEGVDAPVLQWVDNSTAKALSWTVYRIANADGAPTTTWTQVGFIPDPTRTWWADTSGYSSDPLKPGYSAQYIVRATTAAGVGPTSTQVKTGLRPGTSAVRATGSPTTIAVAWDKVIGATGYDVYRDGKLAKRIIKGDPLVWTDGADYGHSHIYQVVATNAWEDHLTSGIDFGATIDEDTDRLATGVDVAATYTGAARVVTPATDPAAGAFTAPAAPTITSVAGTDWSNTVTRTLAGWTGTGPIAKAGVARDRGWEVQTHLTSASWADLWTAAGEVPGTTAAKAHTGRPAGTWSYYQARGCNASGCGPYSPVVSDLQRPPTPPSCTLSGATTRSMVVTVDPAAMTDSAYTAYDVDGGTGTPTNTDAIASNARTVDQLTHSSAQTFTGAAQNASAANGGWSDRSPACSANTATLGVAITGLSSTTRTVNATMATANGSSSSLTLEGVRTDANVGSASWDPLPDGTGYTVTARNSDGWNDVAAQTAVATKTLSAPSVPVCTANVTASAAPGSISIGGGDQVKLGSGGGVYGPRAYSGLGAGTYTGYSRNVASDGYNTAYSGWDPCPAKTITPPPLAIGCVSAASGNSGQFVAYLSISFCGVEGATSYEFQTSVRDTDGNDSKWTAAPSLDTPMGDFATTTAGNTRVLTSTSNTLYAGGRVMFRVVRGAEATSWWTSPFTSF